MSKTGDIVVLQKNLKEEFISAFKAGVDAFQTAGDAIAKLVEINPSALDELSKENCIPISVLRRFLDIGRGKLLPQLFTAPSYVKSLPIADQKRLVEGTVEAVVLKSDGTTDTIKVDVMSGTSPIVRQVIGPRGIRTTAEQRSALVSEANAKEARKVAQGGKLEPMPFTVVGKKIVIGTHSFTAVDLLNMIKLIQ